MSDVFQPAPAGDAGASPDIAALIQQASDPAMPISGRNTILAKIEAYHQANAAAGDQTGPQQDQATDKALAAPASATGYHLESHLPPGVSIENEPALGALKAGLHDLGVPASIASGAFADIGRLHAEGAFATDAGYDAACLAARDQMHRVHGEAAPAMIRDAIAFVDRAVKAGKLTEDAAEAVLASPLALSHAAMLARRGASRR